MIKISRRELVKNNKAMNILEVYVFGILIYYSEFETSNKEIINSLSKEKERKIIKGFKDEN